jgi:hypothetical protein
VDSAEPGSQDDASLFWTSISLELKLLIRPVMTTTPTNTIHLLTGPVNLPAI